VSDEFFYIDANGKKSDALLHEELLDNPEADLAGRTGTARRAVIGGMVESTARQLYAIPANIPLFPAKPRISINRVSTPPPQQEK
jgi:hypothetical protein